MTHNVSTLCQLILKVINFINYCWLQVSLFIFLYSYLRLFMFFFFGLFFCSLFSNIIFVFIILNIYFRLLILLVHWTFSRFFLCFYNMSIRRRFNLLIISMRWSSILWRRYCLPFVFIIKLYSLNLSVSKLNYFWN